ncbi:MAG: PD-(D/E)XK nuclease-like domain-containing protein [Armatimonadota bacterium]
MVIADLPQVAASALDLQDMQPGRYRMSNEDYHRTNAVGKSDLDLIARSPAHYAQAKAAPVDPTSAMILGSAFHVKVLEPDDFENQVAVGDFNDRRTNAYKAWAAENAAKLCILKGDYETICGMHDAIKAHPVASALMTGGIGELSYFWRDAQTGVLCKCRPDYLRADGLIVDLKTCEDASPEGFARAAAKYRYHVQDAHYREGVLHFHPEMTLPGFVFLAIEKTPPYAIGLYLPDTTFLVEGRLVRNHDLLRYAKCQRTGVFPGYATEFQPLSLPNWALKGLEND